MLFGSLICAYSTNRLFTAISVLSSARMVTAGEADSFSSRSVSKTLKPLIWPARIYGQSRKIHKEFC